MGKAELAGARLGALLLVATLVSGCAGARLYSETRDKQGQAAQASWRKLDLGSVVDTARSNLNQVLQAQLDTQDKLAAAIRNNRLRALVEQPLDTGLVANIHAQLEGLIGSAAQNNKAPSQVIAESRLAMGDYQAALTDKASNDRTFTRHALAVPACAEVQGPELPEALARFMHSANPMQRADMEAALDALRAECESHSLEQTYAAVFRGMQGGLMAAALSQQQMDKAQLEAAQTATLQLRLDYQAALKAYNAAVAEAALAGAPVITAASAPTAAGAAGTGSCPDGPKTGAAAIVKAAAAGQRLCQIVSLIDLAQDAFSVSFISQERLDALDKFVTTVTKAHADGTLPADASEAAKAFVLLPQLMVEARNALAAAKKPLALPLMIRRNMEQLKLDGANKEIALLRTRVQLSQAIVESLYAQAVQLWRAHAALSADGSNAQDGLVDMRSTLAGPMVEAFAKATPDQRELLYYAASMYLDAVNRLSARHYKLAYLRIATFQEVSLSYAEVNLKQWSNLIGGTVEQVAESAALGFKPATLSALLNTLGIFYIGQGVNK